MLLIYSDHHMGIVCDRCRVHSPSRWPGECAFTAGVRAERFAVAQLGWTRPIVEWSLGRGLIDDRLLHLCPDCSAVPGPVAEGP